MPHPSCRKWQIRMEVRADTQLFEKDLNINVSACSVTQSCLTLCGPAGPSVHGILQARILGALARPPPGELPDPGIGPASFLSPALPGRFFTISATWEAPDCEYLHPTCLWRPPSWVCPQRHLCLCSDGLSGALSERAAVEIRGPAARGSTLTTCNGP